MLRPTSFFLAVLCAVVLGAAFPAQGEEIVYRSGDHSLKAYLCKPKGAGPFPAVIYNHGGMGTALGGAPRQTCEALVRTGFVGFSPIRREEISMEGNLQDVLSAIDSVKRLEVIPLPHRESGDFPSVRPELVEGRRGRLLAVRGSTGSPRTVWTPEFLGISSWVSGSPLELADSNRIALIGFSRGGLLALMAATQRSDLRAIVVMAPAPGKEVKMALYPPYGSDGHRIFFEVGDYWSDVTDFLARHLS